ncbi:hypothetical protein SK128_025209 [Halocaridina rubra]|uniref:E3 ubiquitin-protein ligase TM129 n=1 Tax=Halocaridina rubra TaxID=373956 RepID=A0AAN8WUF8_HALRR
MTPELWCYSLLYWLFALVVIFPPDELVSAGLTIEVLLGSWLGSQTFGFVQYHIRRTAATLLFHTFLIPGYILMLAKTQPWLIDWLEMEVHSSAALVILIVSFLPVFGAALLVCYWWQYNWRHHPLSQSLRLYAADGPTSLNSWLTVASNVNNEFRRIDKFSTKANSVCRVVATDSWLVKITAYRVSLLHQRDAVLSLEGSVDISLPYNSTFDSQQLNIKVTSIKNGVPSFWIKLTALEYKELERKIVNPIVNARQVVVQQSLSDRFLAAFMETVNLNPKVALLGDIDMCIGCMETVANVKLQRRCGSLQDGSGEGCVMCYCRPMWCLSCLSKWFAARQDQNHPETWLSSRAPCPTCRSNFCLLDVCMIL